MTLAANNAVSRIRLARHLGIAPRRGRVPRARPPTLIEADYAHRLVGVLQTIRRATDRAFGNLWFLRQDSAEWRADDHPGARARIAAAQARAEAESVLHPKQLEHMAADIGRRVSAHQKGELLRQGKAALGIDLHLFDPQIAPLIQGFVHENVSLITKLEGATLDDLEVIVTRAVANGTRAEDVQALIADRYGISERHARLIARDQIGKLSSQIARARHEELGIGGYFWRHSGNKNPRPHHVARNGKPFLYSKPPSDGNPGMAICCHCTAEPDFSSVLALVNEQAA